MTITDTELRELGERRRADAVALKEKLDNIDRLQFPELIVVRVNKQCRQCNYRWHGNFFKSWVLKAPKIANDGKQYVLAWCDLCVETWEREQRRRQIETDVQHLDGTLKQGPTKSRKLRLVRAKVGTLTKLRDTYDPGSVCWSDITDRMRELNETIQRLDK